MERLTDKKVADAERQEYERRLENGYPRNIPEERFLRLSAYEDTGLTPEEVSKMAKEWTTYETILSYVDEIGGSDRLLALIKAEKDGRIVVLPCKFWDNLYVLTNRCISLFTCSSFDILDGNKIFVNWEMEYGLLGEHRAYGVEESEFGKTVFLTREEAEAAMKKREADDEAD